MLRLLYYIGSQASVAIRDASCGNRQVVAASYSTQKKHGFGGGSISFEDDDVDTDPDYLASRSVDTHSSLNGEMILRYVKYDSNV